MADKTIKERIKDMIEEGVHTKKEIAAALDIKESSVSSNMTYLRWGGKFIKWDDEKRLCFIDEAGYDEWQEERKANTKSKKAVSKLTPQEQFNRFSKTAANQEKALANWEAKVAKYAEDAPSDDTLLPEAEAQVTLTSIKLQRTRAKLDAVDMSEVTEAGEAAEEADESDEELL